MTIVCTHPSSNPLFTSLFEVDWGWFSMEFGISEISGIWFIWELRNTWPELCCCTVCSGKDGTSEQKPESDRDRVVLSSPMGCGNTSVESHGSHDSGGKTEKQGVTEITNQSIWCLFWIILSEFGYLCLKVRLGWVGLISSFALHLFVWNEKRIWLLMTWWSASILYKWCLSIDMD